MPRREIGSQKGSVDFDPKAFAQDSFEALERTLIAGACSGFVHTQEPCGRGDAKAIPANERHEFT
ncbi:hypothetical protein GCM10027024_31070 [Microbacterium insulae]